MTINIEGIVQRSAVPVWTSLHDQTELPPLVVPDDRGPWALRYLWVRHREKNEEFLANYFNRGNNASGTGLNLRKQTSNLTSWNSHNAIFELAKNNGDLVWRVKTFNPYAQSIDYVEIWRSPAVLKKYWGGRRPNATVSSPQDPDSGIRPAEDAENLRQGVYEAGFELRWFKDEVTGWPLVSKRMAMSWYQHFIGRAQARDNCIINTPWNRELNPLRPQAAQPTVEDQVNYQ